MRWRGAPGGAPNPARCRWSRGAPGGAPLLLWASLVGAQGTPAYTAAMLDGAAFDERVRASVRTQTGGATRIESVGRDARWHLRAEGGGAAIDVEAWYDSLSMWREAPEGRLVPDTDGLVGGRYRGTISAAGLVTLTTRPFIPDDLAEVSDLSSALTTFLPPLPPAALEVGATWDAGGGFRISRRADSTAAGVTYLRYRWSRTSADTLPQFEDDSLRYEIRSTLREDGHLVWHAVAGPVAWWRDTVTEVEIPAEGPVRRPVRSRVEERLQGWKRRGTGNGEQGTGASGQASDSREP